MVTERAETHMLSSDSQSLANDPLRMINKNRPRVAVVGAGISGLAAAKGLADAGYEVDIYEAAGRIGGKIHTVPLGQQVADRGGEFVDSTHAALIRLADKVNVRLVRWQDEANEVFYMPNGKVLGAEQFYKAYRPVAELMLKDKAIFEADPTGKRARQLDSMTLTQYLQELASKAKDNRSFLQWAFSFGQNPNVAAATMAEAVIAAEFGRPGSQISALQFVHEAGASYNCLLASDCALRVEGGSQALIEALRADLESKGARFHVGSPVSEVRKGSDGKISLLFDKASEASTPFDKVVMATSAHALAGIRGLDALGLSPEDQAALQKGQYSHTAKIHIKTRVPVKNDGFFYSSTGYQAWNRAPGEVVFLVGSNLTQKYRGKALVDFVLKDYAIAHKTKVDKFFDTAHVDFAGPDLKRPCYASPAPGQALRFQGLAKSFDAMAEQGVAVVGTYVPHQSNNNRGLGYMGNGPESAERAVSLLTGHGQGIAQEKARGMLAEVAMNPTQGSFVQRVLSTQRPGSGSGRVA